MSHVFIINHVKHLSTIINNKAYSVYSSPNIANITTVNITNAI